MITSPAFAGKRYAVLGLARSGAATVEALLASGASVTAWDEDETKRNAILPLPFRGEGRGEGESRTTTAPPAEPDSPSPNPLPQGVEGFTLADPLTLDLTGYDGVVVSPGVPLNCHPIAAHAARHGVPVIGDIELFALARPTLPPHKVVGVTGTNGKSTTTALIHHILQTAGVPSLMGGNIGLPILGRDPLAPNEKGVGVYVLELSSYQLDLTFSLDCDVAVLTNITPDHLDRYDGFEAYAASKARLFEMQSAEHLAVITTEDHSTRTIATLLDGVRLRAWHADRRNGRTTERGQYLVETSASRIAPVIQQEFPALQGPHNAQNVAVAVAVAHALSIPSEVTGRGLRTYPGLPHRMERVAEKGGVLFVNDSKATNATATAPALAAYPVIHWILGGRPKADDLDDCKPYLDHVRAGYTIGEAGPMFARILKEAGKPVTESGTLAAAVRDAAAAARAGEVVMLSPACASFDQFKDFEARGEAFRAAVAAL